jgi:hypothetical protein
MSPDFDILGVYIPSLVVWIGIAYALSRGFRVLLTRTNGYQFFWHPSLFALAFFMVLLGIVTMLGRAINL